MLFFLFQQQSIKYRLTAGLRQLYLLYSRVPYYFLLKPFLKRVINTRKPIKGHISKNTEQYKQNNQPNQLKLKKPHQKTAKGKVTAVPTVNPFLLQHLPSILHLIIYKPQSLNCTGDCSVSAVSCSRATSGKS